jgi:hypothetical protein
MAQIYGPDGTTILSVDSKTGYEAVAKGQVVATLYDRSGDPLNPATVKRPIYPIKVRQSAATGAAAVVWALWNPMGSTIITLIKRIWLQLTFDGTAAATLMAYEVVKATGVTVFSGGTVVTPALKRTSQGAPTTQCRVLDTGLTTTGITVQGVLNEVLQGRVTMTTTNFSQTQFQQDWVDARLDPLELAAGEMLAIRQVVTSVVGDRVQGYCEVEER